MKISDDELNQMLVRADYEFDSIKDKCHDLYDENVKLKEEIYLDERIINLKQQKIDNAINYIKWHYDLGTKENVEFCLLRDRLLEILGKKEFEKNDDYEHYSFLLIPDENGTISDANKKRYRLERIDENRE